MKNYSKKKAKPESKENAVQGKKSEIKIPYVIGGVLLALLAVGVIYLLKDKNVIPPLFSQKYITEESDVHMPTTPEGTTEKITDVSGNELIVAPSGTYRPSPFNKDSVEKLMDGKVVPLVGTWSAVDSTNDYVFKNDQTFERHTKYGKNGEKEYVTGGSVSIKNIKSAPNAFKVKNMDGLFELMHIDSSTFVSENLYYVELIPEYYYSTDEPERVQIDRSEFKNDPENETEYVLYTYWLEDINAYRLNICWKKEPFVEVLGRVDKVS